MTYKDGGRVITLVGSTRFEQVYREVNIYLTLLGNVVLSVAFFGKKYEPGLPAEVKRLLDQVHLRKINLSDSVFVLDVGYYVGDSTRSEIEYACGCGKAIWYLTQEFPDYRPGILLEGIPIPELTPEVVKPAGRQLR